MNMRHKNQAMITVLNRTMSLSSHQESETHDPRRLSVINCLMDLDNTDGQNKPALPTSTFINGFLEYRELQEKIMNREDGYQHYYYKSTFMKILLAMSKLQVSIVKCRQILITMILNNDAIFNWQGLALNHMTLVDGRYLPANKIWRNYATYRHRVKDYKMCHAEPRDWTGLTKSEDDRPMDLILFGQLVEIKKKYCCARRFQNCPIHTDEDEWHELSGLTVREWQLTKYAKLVLQGLRRLMESVLVDNRGGFDDVLEIFRQLCAEAIAQHGYIQAVAKIRLYAACVLECTLSSGSYYMLVLANKCRCCEDCRMILKSHKNLFVRPKYDAENDYELLLQQSPLVQRDEILKLSQACSLSFENFKATTDEPNEIPFISNLRISDRTLTCGDIRDILKAAVLRKSYRLLADAAKHSTFFLATVHYDSRSKYSKFHRNGHRHALNSNKTINGIKRAFQLAEEEDLITLRVNEDIIVFAVDRKVEGDFDQSSDTPQLVMDGKDMITLLMSIQRRGGSTIYSNVNFGAFKNASFSGDQTLWIPPQAEDLLQAGVYTSVSGESNEIAVCNVVAHTNFMEGKFSIRKQRKAIQIWKAVRACADFYQCLDDRTKVTASKARDVRIG
ncbi:hypothetical protein BGW37DRAFT_233631 [Umbelopsis sp. PMI_123]|nr:hypothetical protein BGW37DRAFT_233631 [Umbelopsis sp. PMI_123]